MTSNRSVTITKTTARRALKLCCDQISSLRWALRRTRSGHSGIQPAYIEAHDRRLQAELQQALADQLAAPDRKRVARARADVERVILETVSA